MAALQAMFEVQAPLALDRLIDVMDDERVMFKDFRVCDNALWIFNLQIGLDVVDGAGTFVVRCSPEVAAYLDRWYADARTHLEWEATQAHWIDGRESPRAR